MAQITVLIVDDIASTLDNLRKLLSFEEDIEVVATATNGQEAVDRARELHPSIVLMDVNMPEMDGIQATELMASEAPTSPVIIMSVQGERDYLRRAMQAGAREFLIKPFSGDELVASIRRVYQLELRKETYANVPPPAPPAPAPPPGVAPAAPAEAEAPVAEAETDATDGENAPVEADAAEGAEEVDGVVATAVETPEASDEAEPAEGPAEDAGGAAAAPARPVWGELIVLYGGKGGVGKSVIATNLACALAREVNARVALIDLDLQFGDIGVLLNLSQSQSIADVVENFGALDAEFVSDIMAEGPAGIRVLPTAPSPELADLVTPEHVQRMLNEVRTLYDFVVIDTSAHMGDITLTALDMATRVVLVSALSIPSVKNAKLALRLFETLQVPTSSITLVLNRCEAHTEFNKDSIESHLKFPISVQIPHDPRTVVNSINRGTPFVVSNPEAEASQRLRELVLQLLPDKAAEGGTAKKSGRRFGRR